MSRETEAATIALGDRLLADPRLANLIEHDRIGELASIAEDSEWSTGERVVLRLAACMFNNYRHFDLGTLLREVDDATYARCVTAILHRRPVENEHLLGLTSS